MKKAITLFLFLFFLLNMQAQQWAVQGYDLQRAVPDGRVDSVWLGIDLPQGYSGKDVIIGFTDWGFDYTHPVFYDTTMSHYRVLRAWDQYRQAGPPPQGFTYGTEIVGKDALLEAQCDTSNVYDYAYHGNHVASIAGGAGAGTIYRGVAYEADLLFVSIAVDAQAIIDAFVWMHQVAQEEQKRLVINMSWGLYYIDNMDGTGRMAEVVDSLSNLGVVFVSSAGNNGDENFHLHHLFETEDTLKSQIGFASGSAKQWGQSISMISSPNTSFSFALQVLNSSNVRLGITPFYNTEEGERYVDSFLLLDNGDTIFYNAFIERSNVYNDRPQVRFRLKKPTGGSYKMGLMVAATEGDFHAWNLIELTNDVGNWGGNFSTGGISGWKAGDANHGIGAPASFESVITVAAHASQYQTFSGNTAGGNIASFSSYGPTMDNRLKPEVSAPGYNVKAAISSFTNQFSGTTTMVNFNGRNYPFGSLSGTSMSSPFVAGVAALILQANPNLTPAEVKAILTETAYQDNYTEQHGQVRFGYGKVNAYHAIYKALGIVGVTTFPAETPRFTYYPNPASDMVFLSLQADARDFTLELYDLCGKLIQKQKVESGVNTINVQHLPAGCYIARLSDGQNIWTSKLIKN
ncbi:S8 family peptidase [Bacteroidales bacterium OttesenSCG-928-L19]|nr:S8 family peptidase [Bacteroidales bacterium OttesenSCG-928-L19]